MLKILRYIYAKMGGTYWEVPRIIAIDKWDNLKLALKSITTLQIIILFVRSMSNPDFNE